MSIGCGSSGSPIYRGGDDLGDINSLLNKLFWCSLIFAFAYFVLDKFVQLLLRTARCGSFVIRPTVRFSFDICYYLASTLFLLYYHRYFVQPEVAKEDGRYFPKYENLLFFLSSECNLRNFRHIFVVTVTFHILGIIFHLRESDYTDAVTRLLFTAVIGGCYAFRYEHYFLELNIIIGGYQMLTHSLFLIALHTKRSIVPAFNVCALLHFLSWTYVFLTRLPFQYLLPTLYMHHFNGWLNLFCWSWYGACVWNSPILQVIYHQSFHSQPGVSDCLGEGSVAKCLLLRETKELRHLKLLKRSVDQLKEASDRSQGMATVSNGAGGDSSQSAKVFQTLKCIMTLKRKIKRIRAANQAAASPTTADDGGDGGGSKDHIVIKANAKEATNVASNEGGNVIKNGHSH